jgi:hypothetical protein
MKKQDYEKNLEKNLSAFRKFEQGTAGSVRAYIILSGSDYVGKINVKYPSDGAGRLRVFVWDWSDSAKPCNIQQGTASGYGYDKLDSALEDCTFGGETIGQGNGTWEHRMRERGFTVIQAI